MTAGQMAHLPNPCVQGIDEDALPKPGAKPLSDKPLDMDFVYPVYDVCVDHDFQNQKLACCNIGTEVFGDYVDITHYAMETILAAKRGGASINGSVHVTQYFEQHRPIEIGETITLKGAVTNVEDVPKGSLVTSRFDALSSDGDVPLVLERTSLRVDASKANAGSSTQKPPPTEVPALTELNRLALEPSKVTDYSAEGSNLIHSDPEVAKQFGFRAPIAAGLMAVRFMMAQLWRKGPVQTLKMSIRFRRPMFWDEELVLNGAGDNNEHLFLMRSSDGKVANEAHVQSITYK